MRNKIVGLLSYTGTIEDVGWVKGEVKHHFKIFFKEKNSIRPNLEGVPFDQLRYEDISYLEDPFLEEHMKELVWLSAKDKSPRLDGFNLCFYKECWEIIRGDIINFVSVFHINAKIPKVVTTAFLALILKLDNPEGLD